MTQIEKFLKQINANALAVSKIKQALNNEPKTIKSNAVA